MPSKHIDKTIWEKVEKETVKAVLETKQNVKDTKMLNYLILKGLNEMTEKDYMEITKKK